MMDMNRVNMYMVLAMLLLFIKRVGGDLANTSSHPRLLLQRRPEWFGEVYEQIS